ncbi:MAG: translesion error-prone DNA polymerase V autoproteolytic subunit [Chthoniobacterales bacterium]|nr:translesion error-prone DNA polymerase V autoproteolytic subunit [Chthoniobacterales bacterium]
MALSTPIPFAKRLSLKLPLVSASVEAGFPSPADDHMERGIDLNEELIRNPAATFLIRVQGESMRDAGIHSGDTLIVDKSVTPYDRQIVVAMIDGEFTVKRLRKKQWPDLPGGGQLFLCHDRGWGRARAHDLGSCHLHHPPGEVTTRVYGSTF